MANEKTTKAEFVWAMVKLAAVDREAFRKLRAHAWSIAQQAGSSVGKSEFPN